MFDSRLQDIVNFDILPTEYLYQYIKFTKTEDEDASEEEAPKGRRLSDENGVDFEEYYDLTDSFGSYIIPFVTGLISTIIYYLIRPYRHHSVKVAKTLDSLEGSLFWDGTLRGFIEGYMNLSLGSLIMVTYHLDWNDF